MMAAALRCVAIGSGRARPAGFGCRDRAETATAGVLARRSVIFRRVSCSGYMLNILCLKGWTAAM
jgi:hypothetical protein